MHGLTNKDGVDSKVFYERYIALQLGNTIIGDGVDSTIIRVWVLFRVVYLEILPHAPKTCTKSVAVAIRHGG